MRYDVLEAEGHFRAAGKNAERIRLVVLARKAQQDAGAVLSDHEFLAKEPPRRVNFERRSSMFAANALPKASDRNREQ